MLPNLMPNDSILVASNPSTFSRGDIVLYWDPVKEGYIDIDRIVGLHGEQLEIVENSAFVNSEELVEPYLSQEYCQKDLRPGIYPVPANSYFVMGDNRDASKDSRFYGSIPKEKIFGKYLVTIVRWGSD